MENSPSKTDTDNILGCRGETAEVMIVTFRDLTLKQITPVPLRRARRQDMISLVMSCPMGSKISDLHTSYSLSIHTVVLGEVANWLKEAATGTLEPPLRLRCSQEDLTHLQTTKISLSKQETINVSTIEFAQFFMKPNSTQALNPLVLESQKSWIDSSSNLSDHLHHHAAP